MDRKAFFDAARKPVFGGSLSAEQVKHVEAILDACAAAKWPLAWVAYGLATAKWETDHFTSLIERGGAAYFKNMYDPLGSRPALAKRMGNTNPGDGAKFRGRGYVHLTWANNYAKAGKKLGVDLVANPDLAMRPDIAAAIMIAGMAEGWFTGKKMADYLDKSPPDHLNARRIINGTDKAAEIAAIARKFEAALVKAGYGRIPAPQPAPPPAVPPVTTPTPKPKPSVPPTPPPAKPAATGLLAALFALFRR